MSALVWTSTVTADLIPTNEVKPTLLIFFTGFIFKKMLVFMLLSLSVVVQTTAYSSGAPDNRCSSMTPGHGTVKAGQGSFTVTTASNSITTQESVRGL